MTIGEKIRKLNHAQPFEPFVIYTSDGKALRVKHSDYCFVTPRDAVVYVYDVQDQETTVAVRNVTRVERHVSEAAHGEE